MFPVLDVSSAWPTWCPQYLTYLMSPVIDLLDGFFKSKDVWDDVVQVVAAELETCLLWKYFWLASVLPVFLYLSSEKNKQY